MKFALSLVFFASVSIVSACQSNGGGGTGVTGNEGGSVPVSEQESYDMQKAVNRCHRTGGSRVVKIKGELKCY